ncbi:D-arabinose 5-phosphate isomerase [hydrothermal vent metagenome]|uniref:D-arabinose 5-phosphate isomerase n=1 Tax=hydrothermal vent metagenome TaxID=652676 RepID=A0A3B1C3Q7_9ZZZZ
MNDPDLVKRAIASAVKVAVEESEAVGRLESVIRSQPFSDALALCFDCKGIIYILGMGKSGLVGQKIAATLTSAGTPSVYIHAGDALHGDLGAIRPGDVAILISKSGQTKEVVQLIGFLNDQKNPIIAITNDENSSLAKAARVALLLHVKSEACPMNLAPMTSTTAMLALGDALAAALIVAKNFRPENFARFHPGGKLGWMLTAKVSDMIDQTKNPTLKEKDTLRNAVVKLVEYRIGGVNIVDEGGRLTGLMTDGDLKRIMVDSDGETLDKPVAEYMTRNPITANIEASAAETVDLMENRKSQIYVLPVVDKDHRPVGILRLHDIIRSHM